MGDYRSPKSVNYENLNSKRQVLGTYWDGVTKEVTVGRWSGELRLDIRKWKDGCLGKGISLTEEEVHELRKILDETVFGR